MEDEEDKRQGMKRTHSTQVDVVTKTAGSCAGHHHHPPSSVLQEKRERENQ